jgi:large subunit ribosomal protein L3
MAWLLASKLEMTRIVKGNGFVPVTLLKVPALKVVALKTKETDGYTALVLGVLKDGATGQLKEGRKALSFNEFSKIREILVDAERISQFNVGDDVTLNNLDGVESVELTSYSKWKWFTWAMKRHNFSGWHATHGSKFHRALGSIGTRKPRRTHKNRKMHGHHWDLKINLKNVPVEIVNKDLAVFGVRWPVPGARNSLVIVKF